MARLVNRLKSNAVKTLTGVGRHPDGGGLHLSISPNGGRRWTFVYRWQGKRPEIGFGSARDVPLATARQMAAAAREALAKGINPKDVPHAAALPVVPTFGEVAEDLIAAMAPSWRNPKHAAQWHMTLMGRVRSGDGWKDAEHDYCGPLRPRPVDQIRTDHVLEILQPIWEIKAETAARLRGRIERVMAAAKAADVGTSLSGGMSVLTVAAQQLPQIVDVFASSKTATVGGVLKQIWSGTTALITPMRALGLGIAAVGVGGALMYSSWKGTTLVLDDAARSADLTTRELSKLQAVASVKGISNDEFNKGIQGFARGVYDAKNGMGDLAQVFAVNNKHAADFDGYLGTAADLIKNARNDQQRLVLLQQMGLPATMEWVRLLSGGAEGLRKAKDGMNEFAANPEMVASTRRFTESWNQAWANFGLNGRNAFQKVLETGGGFLDRMERLSVSAGNASFWDRFLPSNHQQIALEKGISALSPFEQRFAGDSKNTASGNTGLSDAMRAEADRRRNQSTLDAAAVQHDIQMQQQRLGALSQVATVNEQVRQSELALTAARLQPGNKITDADVVRIMSYNRASALGLIQIRSQTDAYNLETSTLGMATGAAVAYATVQQRINAEKLKGNELSPLQIAALRSEASALGQAAQNAENMRFGYDSLTSAGQAFQSSIRSGASAFDSLKAAGASALDTIASRLMKMATDNLWSSAFGGSSGGIGSFFSGIFGGGNAATTMGSSGLAAIHHTGYGPGDVAPMRAVPMSALQRCAALPFRHRSRRARSHHPDRRVRAHPRPDEGTWQWTGRIAVSCHH